MTEKQAKELEKSLKKFGLVEIPAIDLDNTLLAGHMRMATMIQLGRGEEEIDVRVPNRKLTDAEAKEYNLRSNKNTGEWDVDKLFAMPIDLLKESGFSSAELDLLLNAKQPSGEDEYDPTEELAKPPKAKFGDVYALGEHKLVCGDSTDLETYRKLLGNERAALMFTDPPYNIAYEGGVLKKKREMIENDKMGKGEFETFLQSFLSCSMSYLDGACYVCMSSSELDSLKRAFEAEGGHWQGFIIWVKDRFALSRTDYQQTYEPILYGWPSRVVNHYFADDRTKSNVLEELSGVKSVNDGEFTVIKFQGFEVFVKGNVEYGYVRRRSQKVDVWRYNKPSKSVEHPTMKPIELVEEAVKNSSKQDDVVLDPFGGSGSTLIACENLGRKARMIELDPKYVDVIIDRWQQLTGQKAIKL